MEYTDEVFIRAMNKHKAEQQGDIYSSVFIREEIFEFERQMLFQEKMSIMLPKKFFDMPLELAKIKYPMEQRPQIIKTNEIGDINFTFSLLEEKLENNQVEKVKDGLVLILKRAYPANIFYENKIEKKKDKIIGWFDFKSHGIDQKLYNLMYLLPIEGKFLHGIFNCPLSEVDLWKPVVLQVIHSIEDLTITEGKG